MLRGCTRNHVAGLQLKAALTALLEQEGASKPERCRFFRGQMQTIISTALSELNIKPVPSRRCFSLYGVLMTVCLTYTHKPAVHLPCCMCHHISFSHAQYCTPPPLQ